MFIMLIVLSLALVIAEQSRVLVGMAGKTNVTRHAQEEEGLLYCMLWPGFKTRILEEAKLSNHNPPTKSNTDICHLHSMSSSEFLMRPFYRIHNGSQKTTIKVIVMNK
eukprot:gene5927-4239_t